MSTKHVPLPQFNSELRYDVEESIALLKTSRRSIYQLIAQGHIRPIKQGRRTFIAGVDIAKLSRSPEATAA